LGLVLCLGFENLGPFVAFAFVIPSLWAIKANTNKNFFFLYLGPKKMLPNKKDIIFKMGILITIKVKIEIKIKTKIKMNIKMQMNKEWIKKIK